MSGKMVALGMNGKIIRLIKSCMEYTYEEVVVAGEKTFEMQLRNMVFRGTVLGPTLWNFFLRDPRKAINAEAFREITFADDLNATKDFPNSVDNSDILEDIGWCQAELHEWGTANCVVFEES